MKTILYLGSALFLIFMAGSVIAEPSESSEVLEQAPISSTRLVRNEREFRNLVDKKLAVWNKLVADMENGGKKHPFKKGETKDAVDKTVGNLKSDEAAIRSELTQIQTIDPVDWKNKQAAIESKLDDMRNAYGKVIKKHEAE